MRSGGAGRQGCSVLQGAPGPMMAGGVQKGTWQAIAGLWTEDFWGCRAQSPGAPGAASCHLLGKVGNKTRLLFSVSSAPGLAQSSILPSSSLSLFIASLSSFVLVRALSFGLNSSTPSLVLMALLRLAVLIQLCQAGERGSCRVCTPCSMAWHGTAQVAQQPQPGAFQVLAGAANSPC